MKIRKAIKMAVMGAAVAAPLGMAVAATSPQGAFTWSVDSNGNITVDCPTGFSCAPATNTGAGFLQRQITDSSGTTFIQTINAETDGGTGTFDSFAGAGAFFADESYVVMGGTGGLSGRQQLMEDTGTVFTSNAQLNTGSEFMPMESLSAIQAGSAGTSMIELDQSVVDAANEFDATFAFDHGMVMGSGGAKFALLTLRSNANDTAAGFTSGFDMQDLTFEGGAATWTQTGADATYHMFNANADLNTSGITQKFLLEERSGAKVGVGTIAMPNGTSATYTNGDFVARLQVGQDVAGAGVFGLTDFANETNGGIADTDSFTTSSVPFGTITGSDPFGTF